MLIKNIDKTLVNGEFWRAPINFYIFVFSLFFFFFLSFSFSSSFFVLRHAGSRGVVTRFESISVIGIAHHRDNLKILPSLSRLFRNP
jgi:hypothetical protein